MTFDSKHHLKALSTETNPYFFHIYFPLLFILELNIIDVTSNNSETMDWRHQSKNRLKLLISRVSCELSSFCCHLFQYLHTVNRVQLQHQYIFTFLFRIMKKLTLFHTENRFVPGKSTFFNRWKLNCLSVIWFNVKYGNRICSCNWNQFVGNDDKPPLPEMQKRNIHHKCHWFGINAVFVGFENTVTRSSLRRY